MIRGKMKKVSIEDEKAPELKFRDFSRWKNAPEKGEIIGDLMTVKEFLSIVASGGFNDYDGHGKLATEIAESNVYIKPSDMFHKNGALKFKFPKWATHIIWFNK